jgi:hypothetical protein
MQDRASAPSCTAALRSPPRSGACGTHPIALGLSLFGLVPVSPSVVEPLIAISNAYVAIENIFLSERNPWRLALVFAFELLHGLGFGGV